VANADRREERIDRGIKVRSDGIYALMSWRELGYLTLPRLVLIVGLLLLPMVMPGLYWQRVITNACIFALLALSFDFLAHFVGLVSLGGALFIGVGAYLAAIFNKYLGLSLIFTIPMASLSGAAICTLLLLPCLPLRGVYFAIVSLMYPLALMRIIEALNILGGTDGIMGIDSFPSAGVEQYFMIIMVLLFLFALRRLVNLDIGLVFRGVKDNDQAVRASGMSITLYKAVAVFIASTMGCLAGASLSHIYMFTGISLFGLDFSILPIAATVIGGGGTLAGPVIGCLILVPLSEVLREFGTLRIAIYAIVLMLFIVVKSEGLMVYGQRKYHQFERWVKI